jgi:hypothetical protein
MRNVRIPGSILLTGMVLVATLYDVTETTMSVLDGLALLALTIAGSFMLVFGGEDE